MARGNGFRPRDCDRADETDAAHWVDTLREGLLLQPAAPDGDLYERAYDAGIVDAETMFAYFEGRLSPGERAAVEAEVAASPVTREKFALVAAAFLAGAEAETDPPVAPRAAAAWVTVPLAAPRRVSSPREALESPRLLTRTTDDTDLEVRRFVENGTDTVRLDHAKHPVGTLLAVEWRGTGNGSTVLSFAVLRTASDDGAAAARIPVPAQWAGQAVSLALRVVEPHELAAEDRDALAAAYRQATQSDAQAVTSAVSPRSAWQQWADRVAAAALEETGVDPSVLELADQLAAGHPPR